MVKNISSISLLILSQHLFNVELASFLLARLLRKRSCYRAVFTASATLTIKISTVLKNVKPRKIIIPALAHIFMQSCYECERDLRLNFP